MENMETLKISCPACGKTMKEIYVPEQNIHVDICLDGCGGLFLDRSEYKKVDEKAENISTIINELKEKEFEKTDESLTRVCPICNTKMVKHFASAKHEVKIDECYGCGATFLDYSELEKIRAQYNTEAERAQDVIDELFGAVGTEINQRKKAHANIKQSNNPLKNTYTNIISSIIFKS